MKGRANEALKEQGITTFAGRKGLQLKFNVNFPTAHDL